MKTLIPERDWLKDVIHPDELQAWNPQAGPCCTPTSFKLNLKGTPLDDWNVSASRVFTDHFLATHPDSYNDTWEIRQMVLKKTQAHIKSLIKRYRQKDLGGDVLLRAKLAHRGQQRKASVSHFHPTVVYLSSTWCTIALLPPERHNLCIYADGATTTHARRSGH